MPDDPIVSPVLEMIRAEEYAPIANHSIRSYLFARLLARHKGPQMCARLSSTSSFALAWPGSRKT